MAFPFGLAPEHLRQAIGQVSNRVLLKWATREKRSAERYESMSARQAYATLSSLELTIKIRTSPHVQPHYVGRF